MAGLTSDSREFALAINIRPLFRAFTSVGGNFEEISLVLRAEGVVSRRRHSRLDGQVRQLVRSGDLARVLPGVYAPVESITTFETRIAALRSYDSDAVLTNEAAARISYWPDLPCSVVTCAVRGNREPQPGYRFVRRRIPVDLIVEHEGLRLTVPALTALDLCDSMGGDAIDHFLRRGQGTVAELHRAMELTTARVGNPQRRQLLHDSRDEPWSAAERLLHRLLRKAGVRGWEANVGLVVDGSTYRPDAVFRGLRLLIEVDGWKFHSGPEVFETDRWRQNLLVLDGWCILRFTHAMLTERPEEVLAIIRRAIDMLTPTKI